MEGGLPDIRTGGTGHSIEVSIMSKITIQSIIDELDTMETRRSVVDFVQRDDISKLLTEFGIGVSYDCDSQEDSEEEMSAFEEAEVWVFEKSGAFVRLYEISKADSILNDKN